MGVEENSLRNKSLYKIELYLLKVMPMLIAAIYLINTVLSYYDIILPVLSYIGGLSLILLVFMYISSYVFRFCMFHRMFIHYNTLMWLLNIYDMYIGIPVNDRGLLSIYLIITTVFMFIILHIYVKNHRKATKEYS